MVSVGGVGVWGAAVAGSWAGALGAGAGVRCARWRRRGATPAPADLFQVIFGGPRLYPTVTVFNVVAGLVATMIVAVFATLYPARLAVAVQPVVAIQGKE